MFHILRIEFVFERDLNFFENCPNVIIERDLVIIGLPKGKKLIDLLDFPHFWYFNNFNSSLLNIWETKGLTSPNNAHPEHSLDQIDNKITEEIG